jgi:type IV secretory pathway VirB10-like protein
MLKSNLFGCVVALAVALSLAGCSKKAEEPTGVPTEPTPAQKTEAPATKPAPPPATPSHAAAKPSQPDSAPAPTDPAHQVAALESQYQAAKDADDRVDVVYKLAEVGNTEAVHALGRLFQVETDTDLKVDLLDALQSIENQSDAILPILANAVQPNQPQEVREAAIDGYMDIGDPRGIQALQALLNDPNEDIRDEARDAIELLKQSQTNP